MIACRAGRVERRRAMGNRKRQAGFARDSAGTQLARLRAANERLQDEIGRRLRVPEKSEVERILVRALIDQSPDYLFVKDIEGRFVVANRAVVRDSGLGTEENVIGKTDFDIHPAEVAAGFFAVEQEIARTGEPCIDIEETVTINGVKKVFSTVKMPLRDGDGEIVGIVGVSRDISDRKRAEFLRAEQGRILEMIATNRPLSEVLDSLLHVIEGQLPGVLGSILLLDEEGTHLSHGAAPSLPESYNQRVHGLAIGPAAGSCGTAAWRRESVEVADVFADPLWAEYCHLVAPLSLRSCWSTPILSHEGAVLGTFAMYSKEARKPNRTETHIVDIATGIAGIAIERRQAEERIRHLANHDPLTGLPNRALLMDRLSQTILYALRFERTLAVACVDLDNFKQINDGFGHNTGDELLKIMAARIVECCRTTDTVVRLGGDEFVVLVYDQTPDPADIGGIARTLRSRLAEPVHLDGHVLRMTSSIGLASYPADGADAKTLLMNADAAMHRAKEMGRNNIQFSTARLSAEFQERLSLQEGLRDALARGEFHLLYQPQVDARTGRIFAAEALLRWNNPELGPVSPAKFIPIAEESGLIVEIGDWVLQAACRQAKTWQLDGLPPISVSINVSAHQFMDRGWVGRVRAALVESGLAAEYLELELTESLIVKDVPQAVTTMRELTAMGLHLSIDDFSTGYSSLNALKNFPVARLKIDQSFVREIPGNEDDKAIAAAVISLGHQLKLKVIAEGVETQEQLDFLRASDCDEFQGYLFSKPVPAREIRVLLKAQSES